MDTEKIHWQLSSDHKLSEIWPKDEQGKPITPAFLCNCKNTNLSDELKINMLQAYGIPCLKSYPLDGSFGKIVLGVSGTGTDLFVPETMLEEAKALCKEENNEEL